MSVKEHKGFHFEEESNDLVYVYNPDSKAVQELEKKLEVSFQSGLEENVLVYPTLGKIKAKYVYLIPEKAIEKDQEKVVSKLTKLKQHLVLVSETFTTDLQEEFIEKWIENHYVIDRFKNKKEHDYTLFVTGLNKAIIQRSVIIGEAVNSCRDLVNTPYNFMRAKDLAHYAEGLNQYDHITVKIYNKKDILEMNMGSYLGVNAGSKDEPRLIFIHYKNADDPVTALVGKGVMYDTGGYSLKTPTGMPGMKGDMAGAAATITAIEAIAKLKLKANVMTVVAATDNRIGDDAIVPDDIITAANGKTIEIISTDAEGRLTLADAVWFAQEKGAQKVIDVATLTGSIVMALGKHFTGAYTNNQEFYQSFEKATKKSKEPIWQMPVIKAHHDELKSNVADMTNKGGRLGGANVAAAFIENFINDDTAWIHLDIAGTSSIHGGSNKGMATGVMVKSFISLFN
jgi:leucyl aminopeptidase